MDHDKSPSLEDYPTKHIQPHQKMMKMSLLLVSQMQIYLSRSHQGWKESKVELLK